MTKLELIESWMTRKGNQPYTFADLVAIVDEASQIGANLKQAELVAMMQDEIMVNADAQRNPNTNLGELVIPNVGLMNALRIVWPEDDKIFTQKLAEEEHVTSHPHAAPENWDESF